ncbi:MAG: General secretion pathway protein F [uncultured Sulfurovum sp.]|uniref:General secretion pathway protein F n=1 Tax=uncultured Sulfurovum sp. TaxID=269237 RepID=A0A6S6T974_9BACT|nr:MAG: General secretion pathway protein F [uncultured Sulfurovum sp.]
MKRITYQSSDAMGNMVQRVFIGENEEFQRYIEQNNLYIYSIKEETVKIEKGKFKHKDFRDFLEEFLYLSKSGMPIDQSLKNLHKVSSKVETKFFIDRILAGIKDGTSFSLSLEKAFSEVNYKADSLVKSLIAIGEEIGELDQSIERALEHMKYQEEITSQISQAIRYPIFLLGMSVTMVFFVFWFVVPKFSAMFTPEEFERLPSLSYAILSVGKSLDGNMGFVLLGFLSLVGLVWFSIKKNKHFWFGLVSRIDFFNQLMLKIELSYIFRSLGVMLEGGLKIDKALARVIPLINHYELKNLFTIARDEIRKGEKLSNIFFDSDVIAPNIASLISVGENSANLEKIFLSVGDKLGKEFNVHVKKILSLLEPLIIIFVGMVIAVIVVSIMLAVVSLTDLTEM